VIIRDRRVALAAVAIAASGVVTSTGGYAASAASASAAGTRGWSQVPSAARGPIEAALRREGVAAPTTGPKQSALTATGDATAGGLGDQVAVFGNTVVVGSYTRTVGGLASEGAVYVFTRPTAGWRSVTQTATLTSPSGHAHELFGYDVAIAGATIAVAAVDQTVDGHAFEGAVYLYAEPASGWKSTGTANATLKSPVGADYEGFGGSVAMSVTTVVVGVDGSAGNYEGTVYVFTRPTHGWKNTAQGANLTPFGSETPDELFGRDIGISGNTIVVSAIGVQRAYLYVKPSNGPWVDAVESRELQGDSTPSYEFGDAVAISGRTVVVGENEATISGQAKAGAAFVFVEPSTGWGTLTDPDPTAAAVLEASAPAANDQFGEVVSVLGSHVMVAAMNHTVATHGNQGAVYVFSRPPAGWANASESSQLVAANGASGDLFGNAIGQGASYTVVGARSRQADTGAVYVFASPGPRVSSVAQAHRRWVLGSRSPSANPPHAPHGGTVFSLTLSQAATVSLVFTEKVGQHTARRGTLTFHGTIGANRVYVDGPLGRGHELVAGRGTVTIIAKNANGQTTAKRLHFVVAKQK
jgi:FG-GAP repeat